MVHIFFCGCGGGSCCGAIFGGLSEVKNPPMGLKRSVRLIAWFSQLVSLAHKDPSSGTFWGETRGEWWLCSEDGGVAGSLLQSAQISALLGAASLFSFSHAPYRSLSFVFFFFGFTITVISGWVTLQKKGKKVFLNKCFFF